MDCRQIQPLLALSVGQDLPDVGLDRTVGLHLQQCPVCRERRQALAMSRAVLQDAQRTARSTGGLWPRVSAQLARLDRRAPLARFNVWVPTAVAALACGILMTIAAVEIHRKVNPNATVFVRPLEPRSRNLFESDPAFVRSQGRLINEEDIAQWQQTQGEPLQPASYPVPVQVDPLQRDF